MTTPNFDNIDKWLFDYVEGNLNVQQEELLENFILNHPDLEVDLDMWKLSNVKTSTSFVNDIEIAKRAIGLKSSYLVNILGVVVILLIAPQDHFQKISDSLQAGPSVSEMDQYVQDQSSLKGQAFVSTGDDLSVANTTQVFHSTIENDIAVSSLQNMEILRNTAVELLSGGGKLKNTDINSATVNDNSISVMPYKEAGTLSYTAQDLQIQETEDHVSTDKNKRRFKLNAKIFLNKLDKMLSKDLAISNYRDHFYLIPETSSFDANLSSTGSVSQSRFQTVSRVRWPNSDQQKFSQQLSFDAYARAIRSGVGAQLNYENYADGTIQDWNAALVLSPKIALTRNILIEPVAKLKIGNKLLNSDKLENNSLAVFNSSSPQVFSFDTSQNIGRKLWYRDLDLGLTLNTSKFYLGVQASNVLAHSEDIYDNDQQTDHRATSVLSVFAGTQYVSRNEKLSFHPYVYIRSFNDNTDYYGGFSLDLDKLFLGASYDFDSQYSASLGLSLDRFALIVQSTRSYTPHLNQNLYTHQLTLRFNSEVSKKTRRYITF